MLCATTGELAAAVAFLRGAESLPTPSAAAAAVSPPTGPSGRNAAPASLGLSALRDEIEALLGASKGGAGGGKEGEPAAEPAEMTRRPSRTGAPRKAKQTRVFFKLPEVAHTLVTYVYALVFVCVGAPLVRV